MERYATQTIDFMRHYITGARGHFLQPLIGHCALSYLRSTICFWESPCKAAVRLGKHMPEKYESLDRMRCGNPIAERTLFGLEKDERDRLNLVAYSFPMRTMATEVFPSCVGAVSTLQLVEGERSGHSHPWRLGTQQSTNTAVFYEYSSERRYLGLNRVHCVCVLNIACLPPND